MRRATAIEPETPSLSRGGDARADIDGERKQLTWLMAEYFETIGCTEIKARLDGYEAPGVLMGTLEDHQPDLTCRQNDSRRTSVIAEVVTPRTFWTPGIENRWSLLASAARLYGAELHFVLKAWRRKGSLEGPLKRRLAELELPSGRIWTV